LTNGPWSAKWDASRELSSGGQGTTYLVRNINGDRFGVLKLLKRQNSPQARKRMRLEVDTLRFLSEKGAAVPTVLDSNVESADDLDVPLYFVMQRIDGETLDDFVRHRRYLNLADALDIVTQIANTVNLGHREGFGHRDLKPKNIMVSLTRDDARLVTILDYGLTFNQSLDDEITRSNENIWNEFLSLPETNIAGAQRRDLRVDVAHLCGLLLFCLTGRYPQLLRDEEDRPPHQRPGTELENIDPYSDTFLLINAFFSRGFRQRANDRFQSVDELLSSLNEIRDCEIANGNSISAIANRESELLRIHDRATQVELAKPRCEKLFGKLIAEIGASYKNQNLGLFKLKNRSENITGIEVGARLQLDWLFPSDRVWVLTIPPHQRVKEIAYGFGILLNEFKIARFVRNANPGKWEVPEIVATYPIDDEPSFSEVILDFKQWLRNSIQQLRREVIPLINR
jgi:serine/threonine protein kinase